MLRIFNSAHVCRYSKAVRCLSTNTNTHAHAVKHKHDKPSFNLYNTTPIESIPDSQLPSVLMNTTKFPFKYKHSCFTSMDLFNKLSQSELESYSDRDIGMVAYSLKSVGLTANYRYRSTQIQSVIASKYEDILPIVYNVASKAPSRWSAKTLRMALFGCQNMTGDVGAERRYLDMLRSKIEAMPKSTVDSSNKNGDSSRSVEARRSKKGKRKTTGSVMTEAESGLFSDSREVSIVLYSLKNLNCEHKSVRELIASITDQLPLVYSVPSMGQRGSSSTSTSARDVSTSVFGLQKCPSSYLETRNLILRLVPMINAYTSSAPSTLAPPTAQEVDNAMLGLKSLCSKSTEVQQLIKCLVPFIKRFSPSDSQIRSEWESVESSKDSGTHALTSPLMQPQTLHAVNISAALHGWQNCYLKNDVVRELVFTFNSLLIRQQHVHVHAQSSTVPVPDAAGAGNAYYMSGSSIGNALYGLRNFSANYREVRELLTLLLPYISSPGLAPGNQYNPQTHTNYFHSPHNISNAVYGLRRMSSDYAEVREFVGELARLIELNSTATKTKRLDVIMSPQEVSNTIYSLQHFNSSFIEVKCLLRSITPYISTCKEPMSGTGVANMLYGMKHLSIQDIEVVVLWNIVTHLMSIQPRTDTNPSSSDSGRLDDRFPNNKKRFVQRYMKPKEIGMAMYGLSNASNDYPEVQEVLQLLIQFIPPVATLPPGTRVTSETAVSATHIACSVYGFRCMKNRPEVNMLIEKILPCLQVNPGDYGFQSRFSAPVFNKHHFYMCLEGIRALDHNHPLTKALVEQLVGYIQYYNNNSYGWTKRHVDASTIVEELERKYPLDLFLNTGTSPPSLEFNPSYAALSKFIYFIKNLEKPALMYENSDSSDEDEDYEAYIEDEEYDAPRHS